MDIATLIGVIAGLALIFTAGAAYQTLLLDPTNLLFVIAGGMIATLVAHPLSMASRFRPSCGGRSFAESPLLQI